jgi:L-aspartate oxidase
VPPPQTRAGLWRCAGLTRTAEELGRLAETDPFPLARKVARSALAREESRGAHQRVDHPATDPELDLAHSVVTAEDAARFERWS